ncbi:hypothetical protein ACOTJD_09315 [Achromobacter xylosoxidans]
MGDGWEAAGSPQHATKPTRVARARGRRATLPGIPTAPPTLLVCSSLRAQSCQRSRDYAQRLTEHGGQAQVLPVARNHGQINADVGSDNDEASEIARFITAQIKR